MSPFVPKFQLAGWESSRGDKDQNRLIGDTTEIVGHSRRNRNRRCWLAGDLPAFTIYNHQMKRIGAGGIAARLITHVRYLVCLLPILIVPSVVMA